MSQTLKDEKNIIFEDRNFLNIQKVVGPFGITEIEKAIRQSPASFTIKGESFIYFSFNPLQGDFKIKLLKRTAKLATYEIVNIKEVTSGYLVVFTKEPEFQLPKINWDKLGVSLFYSLDKTEYGTPPKVLFSDKRFRLLSFGRKDYFCSVKWKSSNPEEGE